MTSAGQDRNEGGAELPRVNGYGLSLATPRRLPKAARLPGRVVVLDIAFASESGGRRKGFEKTTLRLIEQLGPRLVGWIDHHDSAHHARFADDPRFVLATKAQHGACPEMITPALVKRLGSVDTIVCHTDFDGLASAAKWILAGEDPYPDCDSDARAIDTRVGEPGPIGQRFDRALRATRTRRTAQNPYRRGSWRASWATTPCGNRSTRRAPRWWSWSGARERMPRAIDSSATSW